MERYIRGDKTPIPYLPEKYLTEDQLLAVEILKNLGWSLLFIRRPLLESPTVVLLDEQHKHYGLLLDDGDLKTDITIALRSEAAKKYTRN